MAKITEGKKNKGGGKNTIFEKDPSTFGLI